MLTEKNALVKLANRIKLIDEGYLMNRLFLDREFKDKILELNKRQLFQQGIDSTGKILRSEFARFGNVYANRTIIEKEAKGQPTDRVTLKDTGEFYSTFKVVQLASSDMQITADPKKENGQDLFETWGFEIIGLTENNLKTIVKLAHGIIISVVKERMLR